MQGLEALAAARARVAVSIVELDHADQVIAGDDFVTLPVGGVGIVPLLIEVAARIESGEVDAARSVPVPSDSASRTDSGRWLLSSELPIADLAALAASVSDPAATNALIDLVGLEAVRDRIASLGLSRTALLDRARLHRGPDDAPHFALSSARDSARLFADLLTDRAVSPAVSARVVSWLGRNADLGLVGAATGLDPLARGGAMDELLLTNKTGRSTGIRADAGVIVGPRAGVAYAMIVQFSEDAVTDRLRVTDAFRVLGMDLMEYVY